MITETIVIHRLDGREIFRGASCVERRLALVTGTQTTSSRLVVDLQYLDGGTGECQLYVDEEPYTVLRREDLQKGTLVEHSVEPNGYGSTESLKLVDLARLEKMYFGVS